MTKHTASFLVCIFITSFAGAQNLVLNPSFEQFTECPKELGKSRPIVQNWYHPTPIAIDYFNRCSKNCGVPINTMGTQEPKTGDAYIGLTLYNTSYRSYAQTKLKEPLQAGITYTVEFSLSLSEKSKHAIGNIGAYITRQKLETKESGVMEIYENIDNKGNATLAQGLCRPQIKNGTSNFVSDINNWVTISATFKARGGEQYITIGNFFTQAGTPAMDAGGKKEYAYYFIDDVALYQSGTKPEAFTREVIMPQEAVLRNQPVKVTEVKKESIKKQPEQKQEIILAHATEKQEQKTIPTPQSAKNENKQTTLAAPAKQEQQQLTEEQIEKALAQNSKPSAAIEDEVEKQLAQNTKPLPTKPETQAKSKPTILRMLFFEKNSARILPESEDELLMLADLLSANPTISIELAGHTDESGNEEQNKKLSRERAQAVANFMQMLDIAPNRFTCKGYGSTRPIFNNDTEQGREKNRRVEFRVVQ